MIQGIPGYERLYQFIRRVPEYEVFIDKTMVPNVVENRYIISNYGDIYDVEEQQVIQTPRYIDQLDTNMYLRVCLRIEGTDKNNISYLVHRLLMVCFFPNIQPLNSPMIVNHKNGIKFENFVNPMDYNDGNLEWCTPLENTKHAIQYGLINNYGENSYNSVISEEIAKQVVELLKENKKPKEIINIIKDPNLSEWIISEIKLRKTWTYLTEGMEFDKRIDRRFTDEELHLLCKSLEDLHNEGSTLCCNDQCREALSRNNFDTGKPNVETMRKVFKRKRYINISSQYNF